MSTDMTAAQFKTLREGIGSHEEVAAMLESSRTSVFRWETGARAIPGPVRVLIRILADQANAELEAEQREVARLAKRKGK